MLKAAAVQQRLIAGAFALHQLGLHFNFLTCLRVDLRLKRLVSRQSDFDRVLSWRYQHSSAAALELAHMSHEQSIEKDGCS